jgi:uncharacterized membrane protein
LIRGLLVTLLICFAAAANAFPDRYSVNGVASDDWLNIRAEPNVQSDVVDRFAHDMKNIEVLRVEDNWGYVRAGEANGWVSMTYLAANPAPTGEIPKPFACHGNEPFWTITLTDDGATHTGMDTGVRPLTLMRLEVAQSGYLLKAQDTQNTTYTLIVKDGLCYDSMAEGEFGMSFTLFSQNPEYNFAQTGCCTMQVN